MKLRVGLLLSLVFYSVCLQAEELKFFNAVSTKKESPLEITIEVNKRCMFGDFEAILFERTEFSNPSLVLALESVTGKSDSRVQEVLEQGKHTTELVTANRTAKLDLTGLKDGLYTLKLCTSLGAEPSCKDKLVQNISDILGQYRAEAHEKRGDEKIKISDKVYYLQLLLIKNGKLFASTTELQDGQRKELVEVLKQNTDIAEKDATALVKDFFEIYSTALLINPTGLTVSIPRMDDFQKCHNLDSADFRAYVEPRIEERIKKLHKSEQKSVTQ